MPLKTICVAVSLLAALIPPLYAATVNVFDGSLKTTPDQQGWLYITDPLPPPLGPGSCASQSANGAATHLNTNCNIMHAAGYFSRVPPLSHPLMPALDRAAGFTISFEVQILNEFHNNNDRAGFSVIVISHDLKGIELGFWEDEIWAQADAPLFTHAEGGDFDTTKGLMVYRLSLLGDDYFLSADGLTLLSGQLQDYSSFGNPYDIADFVFLGDDTSSASASIKVASITHMDHATIVHCDVNGDGVINLNDAILALQVLAGLEPSTPIGRQVDVNGNGRIGLEEASYIMQKEAGLRQ
ncbi:MAG: dockerin type I repeat-containing protein [Thermodesulfobacteriota bacterium]|nr:dockerin type I repeat-containing protein [Thermodesulfobacteriota bacterium]